MSSKRKNEHKRKHKFIKKLTKNEIENNNISDIQAQYDEINVKNIDNFDSFPLSNKTKQGLKDANFIVPTDIQKQSIGYSLQGKDLLGAAKTGSGKTLAFLIPLLESLYRERWSGADGLGALVITPTRELAYQIFEALKQIGGKHDFSAGLIIGGKPLRDEAELINRINIIICTPGRLLQHMDTTPYFNADNLKILVLDEADKILDMGFKKQINSIVENLPPRQTLLFSATQTKSVKDLARLSLASPVYISVHEHSETSTPASLTQSYILVKLEQKIDILWSFLKSNAKKKILIFLSSCKQVRYFYESLHRLKPGVTLLALHGAMTQLKRTAIFHKFSAKQTGIVLLATDIASRGLDFPDVDWVVQVDAPEEIITYIHRVGRTARQEKSGEAILFLMESEAEGILGGLERHKIPISKIRINPTKLWSIQPRLESLCAGDPELKGFAQRAVVSYIKSVFLSKDKSIFDVKKLNIDKYAISMGLAVSPRLRFLKKAAAAAAPAPIEEEAGEDVDDDEPTKPAAAAKDTEAEGTDWHMDEEVEDDFMTLTSTTAAFENNDEPLQELTYAGKKLSKAAVAKKLRQKKIVVNKKTIFKDSSDEESDGTKAEPKEEVDSDKEEGHLDIEKVKLRMVKEDVLDRASEKEKRRLANREKRMKQKEFRNELRNKRREEQNRNKESESEGELFDASTLPDPDKHYGKLKDGSGEEGEGDDDEGSAQGEDESDEDEEEAANGYDSEAFDDFGDDKESADSAAASGDSDDELTIPSRKKGRFDIDNMEDVEAMAKALLS